MFPATSLGAELIRAVPPSAELSDVRSRVSAALGGGHQASLAGRLPLAAMDPAAGNAGPSTGWTSLTGDESILAAELNQRTIGVLTCLVIGRIGDHIAVGQVVWL